MRSHDIACSAAALDADPRGKGVAVVLCVGHLIVGVVVALIAVGAFAIFG